MLKCEDTLIFPSVTLANHGALPALATRHDALVLDKWAYHSLHQAMLLAEARGAKTGVFAHEDPADLARALAELLPYRYALVAVDGIYSMTGTLPPLAEFRAAAENRNAILYVDAHGTGILGTQGRGTVLDALAITVTRWLLARSRRRFLASARSSPAPKD
jgi:glycine C-acetyltransferase